MSEDIDKSTSSIAIPSDEDVTVDTFPAYMKFEKVGTWAIFFCVLSFSIEVYTFVRAAVNHYSNKDYWYSGLTLTFMYVPHMITGSSHHSYFFDFKKESPKVSVNRLTVRKIFLFLQLPYFIKLSLIELFCKSCVYKVTLEQKKYYIYLVYEDTDAKKFKLFGCFMGSAPHLVLQIYILAVLKSPYGDDRFMLFTQIAACLALLVSLPWSLVSYQRCWRNAYIIDKVSLTWQGIAVQFLWRFFVIAARVLALALFATIYNWYISIVCGVHWIIMFAWIVSMKTSYYENLCEGLGYVVVLAIMYIFSYFDPVDNPIHYRYRYRYAIYYIFMFYENTLLMTLWFTEAEPDLWYRIPALVGHYTSFFLGLLFMLAYYLLYHPFKSRNPEMNQDETGRINGLHIVRKFLTSDVSLSTIMGLHLEEGSVEENFIIEVLMKAFY